MAGWGDAVATRLAGLGSGSWSFECKHLERVKSYAPRVYHVVADILASPVASVTTSAS